MDERRPPYFPRIDDHLVVPELTRDEMIGGRRVVASPAKPPHATQHTRMDYVIEASVAPGYQAATDLLTCHDVESDFASDTCVFKDGVDPETGTRYLEEIAFEVVAGRLPWPPPARCCRSLISSTLSTGIPGRAPAQCTRSSERSAAPCAG